MCHMKRKVEYDNMYGKYYRTHACSLLGRMVQSKSCSWGSRNTSIILYYRLIIPTQVSWKACDFFGLVLLLML